MSHLISVNHNMKWSECHTCSVYLLPAFIGIYLSETFVMCLVVHMHHVLFYGNSGKHTIQYYRHQYILFFVIT